MDEKELIHDLPEAYGPTQTQDVPQELFQPQEQEEVQEPIEQPQEVRKPKQTKSYNFAAMRQQMEQLQRERDEALRKLEDKDGYIELAPDEIAEGKHLTKVQRQIKQLQEDINKYKQQTIQATTEARIKAQFNDFDSVVTTETIEQLQNNYPELATTLQTAPDLYTQAVSAYTLIKKLGIVPESAYESERQRVYTNTSKPRPSNAVSPQHGESPLSKANAFAGGLTEDLQKELWKEMKMYRKNY